MTQPPSTATPPFPPQPNPDSGSEQQMTPRPAYRGEAYRPAGKLKGKRALITGGDSGIGRSVAVLFAREGADVAIVYHQHDADARETASQIEAAGQRCVTLKGDVSDSAFCDEAVRRTVDELGGLDVLVCNAAIAKEVERPEEIDDDLWRRTFAVNVDGYFFTCRAALPHLKPGSAIVCTGSVGGTHGGGGLLAYACTKAADHALVKGLATALADRGIRVNGIAPGPVWTPLPPVAHDEEKIKTFGQQLPLGRPGQPEEIAPAYVYFASEADSGYVTGEIHHITGGKPVAG